MLFLEPGTGFKKRRQPFFIPGLTQIHDVNTLNFYDLTYRDWIGSRSSPVSITSYNLTELQLPFYAWKAESPSPKMSGTLLEWWRYEHWAKQRMRGTQVCISYFFYEMRVTYTRRKKFPRIFLMHRTRNEMERRKGQFNGRKTASCRNDVFFWTLDNAPGTA